MRSIKKSAIAVLLTGLFCLNNLAFAGDPTKADIPQGLSPELKSMIEGTFSADPKDRMEACRQLGKMRESAAPAVPFLIRLLDDRATATTRPHSDSVSYLAALALQSIGDPAVEPTIAALKHSSGWKREMLTHTLGDLNDPRAIAALLPLFDDPDPNVRSDAAYAVKDSLHEKPSLAKIPGLIDSMLHALENNDPSVRRYMTNALGELCEPRAFEPIRKMLKDSDATVRSDAVEAIGEIDGHRATPILLEILQNRKGKLGERDSAATVLGKIHDPSVVNVLIETLKDQSEPAQVRWGVAFGFRYADDSRVPESLIEAIKNAPDRSKFQMKRDLDFVRYCDEQLVRATAIRSLAVLQYGKAIPLLSRIATAKDENWDVRYAAAMSLVKITKGAIDDVSIVKIIKEFDAFDEIDRDRVPSLRMIIEHGKTEEVRAAAQESLKYIEEFCIERKEDISNY